MSFPIRRECCCSAVICPAFIFAIGLIFISGCLEPATSPPAAQPTAVYSSSTAPYLTRRAEFKTKLIAPGPSKQPYQVEPLPKGVQEIEYQSGDLKLKAWLFVPKVEGKTKLPALVFFHGGYAFGASDLYDCMPFIKAGYVVMAPWLRGENGLPGNFENCNSEVQDGVAAVRWLSSQDFVDKDHVYTFGHSSGGMISCMLSLMDDVPIKHGGSIGGLYGIDVFDYMTADRVPFDKSDPIERQMRVLPGNLQWMKRKHYAFIGNQDGGVMGGVQQANREIAAGQGMLTIKMIEGDHGSSYPIGMQEYLKQIESESAPAGKTP